jgi:hypothetical protein
MSKSCEHVWEQLSERDYWQDERYVKGYNGYSGMGGANIPFYGHGTAWYKEVTSKCTNCGHEKKETSQTRFVEDLYD